MISKIADTNVYGKHPNCNLLTLEIITYLYILLTNPHVPSSLIFFDLIYKYYFCNISFRSIIIKYGNFDWYIGLVFPLALAELCVMCSDGSGQLVEWCVKLFILSLPVWLQ